MVERTMEDEEDLESLRAAALSSLLKNKSSTRSCNSNTLFHRPSRNKNLISIIPVEENSSESLPVEGSSGAASGTFSGIHLGLNDGESDEYVVIEEGDDIDDDEVDEIIEETVDDDEDEEEVIVTEEVIDSGGESSTNEEIIEEIEEEEDEDALSLASNDSFMNVIESLENEETLDTIKTRRLGVLKDSVRNPGMTSRIRDTSVSPSHPRHRSGSRSRSRSRSRSYTPSRRGRRLSTDRRSRKSRGSRVFSRNDRSKGMNANRKDHSPSFRSRRDVSSDRRRRNRSPKNTLGSDSPSSRDGFSGEIRNRGSMLGKRSRRESNSPSSRLRQNVISKHNRDPSPISCKRDTSPRTFVKTTSNGSGRRSLEDDIGDYKVYRPSSPVGTKRSSTVRSRASKKLKNEKNRSNRSPARDKPDDKLYKLSSRSASPDTSKSKGRKEEREDSPGSIPSLFSSTINFDLETGSSHHPRSRSPLQTKRKTKAKSNPVARLDNPSSETSQLKVSSEKNKILESRRAKFEHSEAVIVGLVAKTIKLNSKTQHGLSDKDSQSTHSIASQQPKSSGISDQSTSKPNDEQEDLRAKITQKRATAASRLFSSAIKSTLVVDPKFQNPSHAKKLDDSIQKQQVKQLESSFRRSATTASISKSKRKVSLIR